MNRRNWFRIVAAAMIAPRCNALTPAVVKPDALTAEGLMAAFRQFSRQGLTPYRWSEKERAFVLRSPTLSQRFEGTAHRVIEKLRAEGLFHG